MRNVKNGIKIKDLFNKTNQHPIIEVDQVINTDIIKKPPQLRRLQITSGRTTNGFYRINWNAKVNDLRAKKGLSEPWFGFWDTG